MYGSIERIVCTKLEPYDFQTLLDEQMVSIQIRNWNPLESARATRIVAPARAWVRHPSFVRIYYRSIVVGTSLIALNTEKD